MCCCVLLLLSLPKAFCLFACWCCCCRIVEAATAHSASRQLEETHKYIHIGVHIYIFRKCGWPTMGKKEKNNKYFTDARAFWPSSMAVKLWPQCLNVSRLLGARFSLPIAFCGAFYNLMSSLWHLLLLPLFRFSVCVCFCVWAPQLFLVRSALCCNVTAFPRIELLESCGNSDRHVDAACRSIAVGGDSDCDWSWGVVVPCCCCLCFVFSVFCVWPFARDGVAVAVIDDGRFILMTQFNEIY